MEIKLNNVCSKNLTKLNITFYQNQIISIIGQNSNEKTDFINLICGYEKIDSGNIEYDGKQLCSLKSIYYLKENSKNMLFNIDIKEDIKFYLGQYNEEKLYELLRLFNLDPIILKKCYLDLSHSEKKKILLIIALMIDSKIIILENPTLGLDTKTTQTLVKCLKKLKREEKNIIITSYNTDFLLEVSDRIVVLDNKKIIEDGNKFDILSNKKVLNKVNLNVPNIIQFIDKVKELKNIKISYRDNINDLIKDVFRYAK